MQNSCYSYPPAQFVIQAGACSSSDFVISYCPVSQSLLSFVSDWLLFDVTKHGCSLPTRFHLNYWIYSATDSIIWYMLPVICFSYLFVSLEYCFVLCGPHGKQTLEHFLCIFGQWGLGNSCVTYDFSVTWTKWRLPALVAMSQLHLI